MLAVRLLAALAGVIVVGATLLSAIRTVVVPRAETVKLTRLAFEGLRLLFDAATRLRPDYAWTDRVMSIYAPVALLSLPLMWLTGLYLGFALLFWASGEDPFTLALEVSGSSLLTLGFTPPQTPLGLGLSFVGAAMAIAIVVLLLVTYLPAMYAAFSDRERQVTLLEARAGSPPSGVELIQRMSLIRGLGGLDTIWESWEDWFAGVQESHSSQPALAFFRSQRADQSWITAAGALLDAAALYVSSVDHAVVTPDRPGLRFRTGDHVVEVQAPQAQVCIRAGYLCLRQIADYFRVPYEPDPDAADPIAVTREEFDAAWDRLAAAEVPLVADRDQAWRDFAGWRVNYETPLLALADIVAAPKVPWVSDRSPVLTSRWG